MRAGHRQGGGAGGCSSGVVCENHLVGSQFSEGTQTHAHTLFEYLLGKPLEAKLLQEYLEKESCHATVEGAYSTFSRVCSISRVCKGGAYSIFSRVPGM